jgi:hypothetical protein
MYQPPVAAGDLDPFGFHQSDFDSDVEVWADCWDSVMVFHSLASQWRSGFSGATGLDYSSIPFVLKVKKIPADRWAELFDDIQVMEAAALQQMQTRTKHK